MPKATPRTRKSTVAKRKPAKAADAKAITIAFGVMGSETIPKKVPVGITVDQLAETYNLANLRVRVNGNDAAKGQVLKEGDSVIAVAATKGGIA